MGELKNKLIIKCFMSETQNFILIRNKFIDDQSLYWGIDVIYTQIKIQHFKH